MSQLELHRLRSFYDSDESATENQEPLLVKSVRRFVLFPIRYPSIWYAYKHAQSLFWTIEQVDLQPDLIQWNSHLSFNDRSLVSRILVLFVASDRIMERNLITRLSNEIQVAEARCFYGFQLMTDNIHYEACSRMLHSFMEDDQARADLLLAVDTTLYLKRRAEWTSKWIESGQSSFGERLVTCAAMHSVLSSCSYAALFWLKRRGVMSGLTSYNDLISQDKACHTNFSCLLFQLLKNPPHLLVIHQIIKEAVEMEQNALTELLPVGLAGLNPLLLSQYIKFVADDLLLRLGYDALYNAKNPLDFMPESRVQREQVSAAIAVAMRHLSPTPGSFRVDEEF